MSTSDEPEFGETFDELVGRNVRAYREARGWTQRQLADRLRELGWPLDDTAITRVEKGQRSLRVAQARQIAAALEKPISVLFTSDTYARLNSTGLEYVTRLNDLGRAMARFLEQEDELRRVLDHVRNDPSPEVAYLVDVLDRIMSSNPDAQLNAVREDHAADQARARKLEAQISDLFGEDAAIPESRSPDGFDPQAP